MTLLEILVALSLFAVLTVVTFTLFTMGARAWMKAQAKAEIQLESKTLNARLIRSIESSTLESVSLSSDNTAMALLSARDTSGSFLYEPTTLAPRWQKFLVYYYLPTEKEIRLREVPVAGTPLETIPNIIDTLGGNVDTYRSDGRVVGRGFDSCTFSLSPDGLVIVETTLSREHYGSPAPQTHSSRIVRALQNS